MTYNASNPARDGVAAGLGNVVSWQAIDTRENSLRRLDAQAIYLARRFRLVPAHARLVAALAFDCGRRA